MAELEDKGEAMPEILSTHPASEKRASDLDALMTTVNGYMHIKLIS